MSVLFPVLTASAQCVPTPSGLITWWRCEGNVFDSVGVNDGSLVGGVWFAEGRSGQGLAFTGSGDDYVRVPSGTFTFPNEGLAAAPFSFELWFKTSDYGALLGQQDIEPFENPTHGYVPALYVGTNGLLYANLFWGLADMLVSTNAVNDGNWHHVVTTYASAVETLYLDGVPVSTMPGAQFGYASQYHYQLGTAYTAGWPGTTGLWFPFKGVIDEVASYNRALTDAEVLTLYNAGAAGKCIGPVLRQRYSFNESPGSTVVHESRRNADGFLLFSSPTPPYTNGTPDGSDFTGTGQLKLAGTSGYVQLPPKLASWLSIATFEVWVTWYGPATSSWQRIFDFGQSDAGVNASGMGTNYIVLCPSRGGTQVMGFEQTTVNPFGDVVDPKSVVLSAATPMPMGRETYVVVTYDHVQGKAQLYVDANLIASVSGKALNPLASITDVNCWLGRSQWDRDPHFNGQFDEFRIWDGVLSTSEIAKHFAGGPDEDLTPVSSPFLTAFLNSNGLILSWPDSFSDFQLQSASSSAEPSWTPVTDPVSQAGRYWTVRLPISETRRFFRLQRTVPAR